MKTMRNTLTRIALLLLVSACGQSEPGGSDTKSKGRAAEQELTPDKIAALRARDREMMDGTIAAFPDIDSTERTAVPAGMENHPLSRYFTGDGYPLLDYMGDFWIVCDTQHRAYIKQKCDDAVQRGIRIGRQVGIKLRRRDLVNPGYWKMINVTKRMRLEDSLECRRNYDGPRWKATVYCREARTERANALLAELRID